eukprot:TRINITY_DN24062_c0_g1_i1.p1 TRINITY_DN24062_c0_g1~~TRINITY_DN24062_c0_g1_i1.p1  ORF type:complete len:322 (+),score=93.35 TRINITY_DN24062_c0_g1_i1:102-1067(+)
MAPVEAVRVPLHVDGEPLSAKEVECYRRLHAAVHNPSDKQTDAAAQLFRTPWGRDFASPECLRRYLVAHGWDVQKALAGIRATVQWRHEQRLDKLKVADFPDCVAVRYLEWNGFTRDGCPVLYIRSRRAVTSLPRERRLRFLLLMLERGVQLMQDTGAEQWVIVADERRKSWRHMDNTLLSQIGPLMYAHYVERLAKMYVIDGSWLFQGMLKIVRMWIDDRTRAKLECVASEGAADSPSSPSEEDDEEIEVPKGLKLPPREDMAPIPCRVPGLLEQLGEECLHSEYGGNLPAADFSIFAERLDMLHPAPGMSERQPAVLVA